MKVRDTISGEIFSEHGDTDFHEIHKEPWIGKLLGSDMCCFAVTQCGELILLDECGAYVIPPKGRFEIVEEEVPGGD
jgi:hypothetical protein